MTAWHRAEPGCSVCHRGTRRRCRHLCAEGVPRLVRNAIISLFSLLPEQDCVLLPSQFREEALWEVVLNEGEPFSLFSFLLNKSMLERATSGIGWGDCLGMWPSERP